MGNTRKVKQVGRFGTRYGVSIRKRMREVEDGMVGFHACPRCQRLKVKRLSKGIWECRKC